MLIVLKNNNLYLKHKVKLIIHTNKEYSIIVYGAGNFVRKFSTYKYSAYHEKSQLTDQLREARLVIEKAIENYKPDTSSSPESFRQLANGLFQAEGCVSAWFNGGTLLVSPIVSIGQTYSHQSLAFFVRLYYEIGKIGKVGVVIKPSGKLYITWQITNWALILSHASKYFSYVYSEKFMSFNKLKTIYELKSNLITDSNKIELIALVYSLTSAGKNRKLSMEEKLRSLNLKKNFFSSEFENSFSDNQKVPSFLFVLGFLLGDGCIYLRLRLTSSGSLNIIPIINFLQKYEVHTPHMFSMISRRLRCLDINSLVVAENERGTTSLRIEGINAVTPLIPLFSKYSSLSYWKFDDIKILLEFLKLHSAGVHTYKKGLIYLLNIIYQNSSNRTKNFNEWKELIENYFNYVDKKYYSGYQFISPKCIKGKQAGWLVTFSVKLVKVDGKKPKNKTFLFSKYCTERKSIEAAI